MEAELPAISTAFQPILDLDAREVFAYEALVRGAEGQSAGWVFSQVTDAQLHALDQRAREKALHLAVRLGIESHLSLNYLPRSLHRGDGGELPTVMAARLAGFPMDRVLVEVTETEAVGDLASMAAHLHELRKLGARVAIDDFGSGHSGLNLLADFQPEVVKLDMMLIRDIDVSGPRQAIVRAVASMCLDLGIDLIAEGVESTAELRFCRDQGIRLFQGYLLAKPAFEALPPLVWF
ncbi:MAG: EAL domain-containing protein [Deltaproteobacteria bacterium]|nr:EAL domain-containing protein [Deltaproteobacteria bacterium]